VRNFIITPANQICVIDVDDLRVHSSAMLTTHYQLRSWNRLLRSIPPAYSKLPKLLAPLQPRSGTSN
jgi:hypothetical protein